MARRTSKLKGARAWLKEIPPRAWQYAAVSIILAVVLLAIAKAGLRRTAPLSFCGVATEIGALQLGTNANSLVQFGTKGELVVRSASFMAQAGELEGIVPAGVLVIRNRETNQVLFAASEQGAALRGRIIENSALDSAPASSFVLRDVKNNKALIAFTPAGDLIAPGSVVYVGSTSTCTSVSERQCLDRQNYGRVVRLGACGRQGQCVTGNPQAQIEGSCAPGRCVGPGGKCKP